MSVAATAPLPPPDCNAIPDARPKIDVHKVHVSPVDVYLPQLSERTMLAAIAMHGMLVFGQTNDRDPRHIADTAFAIADAMQKRNRA